MPINNHIDLLPHLPEPMKIGVRALSFTRWQGVSKPPFNELNVGELTGDRPENVTANMEIVKRAVGVKSLVSVKQVHGSSLFHVAETSRGLFRKAAKLEADGILTDMQGIGLVIKTADCQPVVMFDHQKGVVANIHCGWRGSVKNILKLAVKKLRKVYGSHPSDLWVGIGPSLGPCCFEFKSWRELLPKWMHDFQKRPDHFDFWQITKTQLLECSIPEEQIFCAGVCTKCSQDYFSYRREKETGRMATVVALTG